MLKYFRTRQATLLIDMTDKHHSSIVLFRKLQQGCCALTNLRYRSRRGFYTVGGHRLDRINDQQMWTYITGMGKYLLYGGLTQKQAVAAIHSKACCPELDLLQTLLPRHIKYFLIFQTQSHLQNESRLSDSRLPAEQNN